MVFNNSDNLVAGIGSSQEVDIEKGWMDGWMNNSIKTDWKVIFGSSSLPLP